jgi:hypothetical protein
VFQQALLGPTGKCGRTAELVQETAKTIFRKSKTFHTNPATRLTRAKCPALSGAGNQAPRASFYILFIECARQLRPLASAICPSISPKSILLLVQLQGAPSDSPHKPCCPLLISYVRLLRPYPFRRHNIIIFLLSDCSTWKQRA